MPHFGDLKSEFQSHPHIRPAAPMPHAPQPSGAKYVDSGNGNVMFFSSDGHGNTLTYTAKDPTHPVLLKGQKPENAAQLFRKKMEDIGVKAVIGDCSAAAPHGSAQRRDPRAGMKPPAGKIGFLDID